MERVMAALGLTPNDFADVRELSPAEQNHFEIWAWVELNYRPHAYQRPT
jgi:hypothetical protein